jgi:hypothetical protein
MHTLGGPWKSTVLLRTSVDPVCMRTYPKVLTVLQLRSTTLSNTMVLPAVMVNRASRKEQSNQKGTRAAAAAAALGLLLGSWGRGSPAAAARAAVAGEREVMVTFLSMTVAGNSGLEGNGQVSKVRVTCRHNSKTCGCLVLLLGHSGWKPLRALASDA